MNFFQAIASFFIRLFSRSAAPAPEPAPAPPSPAESAPPAPTHEDAPTPGIGAPPAAPARPVPAPRPVDLPPGNHYPSNRLEVLGPEYRYTYTNGDLINTPAFRAAQSAALKATWGPLRADYETAAGILKCVPWWVLACLHHMECDSNPLGGIDNGDPWNESTVHVPAGRGPYSSLVQEMVDAIVQYQKPENWNVHLTGRNWTDPGWVFWFLTSWNGFVQHTSDGPRMTPPYSNAYTYNGYQLNGVPLYVKGKHVSDNVFDAEAVSTQLGCMAYIRTLENSGIKIFG